MMPYFLFFQLMEQVEICKNVPEAGFSPKDASFIYKQS